MKYTDGWKESETEQNQSPDCFFQENRTGTGDRFVYPLPGLAPSCSPMKTMVRRKERKRGRRMEKHQLSLF